MDFQKYVKVGGRGWRIYRIAFVTVNTVSFSHLTQFGFKKGVSSVRQAFNYSKQYLPATSKLV